MDNKSSVIDFEILGYKVKLREGESESSVSPHDVVELVRTESNKIMDKAPNLGKGEVALLVALQLAGESLRSSRQYSEQVSALKVKAEKALDLIEEVTPTTM